MSFESTCDDPDLIVLQSDSYKKASCRISEEERKVAAFRTALDKTNQDYAELLKKSHHLEEENQKMRYSCQYYYHLYRTAEETISSLKDEISSIGNEKERSEADFDLVLKRTIHINDHNVRELNETVDELSLLRSQISNMTITVRSASNARDHAEQRLERMRATLSQAQRDRDIAQRSLDSARSTIQYLEEFVIKNVTHERDQHQLLAEEALQKVEYCRAHHTSNEMQQHLHNQWMHRMSVQAMEIEDMRSTVCLWKEAAHAARANERKTSACLRESQAQLHELRINMDLLSSEAKSLRTSLEDAEADFRIRERRQDTLIKELRRQLTQQSPNCGTTTLDRPSPIMDAQQNASSPCTEPSPTVRGTPVSEKEEVVGSNGRETPPSSKNNPLLHSEEQVKLLTRLADMQEHVWALENAKRATEGEFLRLSEELQKKDKALRACLREQAAQRTSATRVATSQQPQITDNHVTLGVNKNTQPSAEQVASTGRAGGSILARWWPLTTNNIHPQGSPMHSSSPHSSEFNRIYMLLEYYTLENCRLEELVDELERKVQKDSERIVDLSG